MKAVQIVIEEGLLREVDRSAKRCQMNRSSFIRHVLRERLRRGRIKLLEQRDRAGYERVPAADFSAWDNVATWPDE